MNTTIRIFVMVLLAAFYGCQKSDVSPGVSSSVSPDGAFSGTIVNDSNRIDSIRIYFYDLISKSAISSSGKFS